MWFRNELSSLAEVSLYYEECNELLITLYTVYVTSQTLSLSTRLYSSKYLTGFLRTNEEEEDIFYIVSVKEFIKLYEGQRCLAAFCGFEVWTVDCI